jgi:HK97 family phage prohead protease
LYGPFQEDPRPTAAPRTATQHVRVPVSPPERSRAVLRHVSRLVQYGNPDSAIGTVVSLQETKEGLIVEGKLDLTNPFAVTVYERMLAGTVGEFSIGYHVRPEDEERVGNVTYLKRVQLIEISVVSVGTNRETRLLEIKSEENAGLGEKIDAELERLTSPRSLELARLNKAIDDAARLPKPRDPVKQNVDDFIREKQREIAEDRAAEKRRADARKRLDERIEVLRTQPKIRARTDLHFRIVQSDDLDMERERERDALAMRQQAWR